MNEEIESLLKNKTWDLVEKSQLKSDGKERRLVRCKWVFKKKVEPMIKTESSFKLAWWLEASHKQEGEDFNEVFAPAVKHTSIRILLVVVNQFNWELQQLDVKTAFLNGDLEETIFMDQPKGYVKDGEEGKVCLLKKSLYGLKQSPRQWNRKFDEQMRKIGFVRSLFDDRIYIKKKGSTPVAYMLLYVDDMLLPGPSMAEIPKVKTDLMSSFEMKDLGEARKIMGIDIQRDRGSKKLWLL